MSQLIEGRDPIKGVFSLAESQKIGTGTTTRKTPSKTYWFCRELEDGRFEVQSIGTENVPTGDKECIGRERFLKLYTPEPKMYFSTVKPAMIELDRTLAQADKFRENHYYYSAELEYGTALSIDEDNIRAVFGLGITYLNMGDKARAVVSFERLVSLDGAFNEEHKHLFNEFGIQLRKNRLYQEAIAYYKRAMELCQSDEHVLFNLARVFLEQKDMTNTLEFLFKAVELNNTLEPAIKLLDWLLQKRLIPQKSRERVAHIIDQANNQKPKPVEKPQRPEPAPYVPLESFPAPDPLHAVKAPNPLIETKKTVQSTDSIADFFSELDRLDQEGLLDEASTPSLFSELEPEAESQSSSVDMPDPDSDAEVETLPQPSPEDELLLPESQSEASSAENRKGTVGKRYGVSSFTRNE